MRILVLQESDWVERGPHQSHHLFERLVAKGHKVKVIDFQIDWKKHLHEGLLARREEFSNVLKVGLGGVTVIRPPVIRVPVLSYISLCFTHRLEIERQLKGFKPDVVVGFGLLNSRIAQGLCNKRDIPFVYYIIDELHRLVPEVLFQPIASRVERANYRRSDAVISINEGLHDYTLDMGADSSKAAIVGAGVDLRRFDEADGQDIRERYGVGSDEILLFFMGYLYDFSAMDIVAREIAKRNDSRIKLLIIGKGDLWDKLKKIEEGAGGKVIVEGWKHYDQIPSYVKAADVCLLPSKRDPIMENIVPIKMYEYMAAGRPVLATRLSGLTKEFKEGNGVNYIESAYDVLPLVEEMLVRSTIQSEGTRARQFVAERDWDTIVAAFENDLSQVVHYGSISRPPEPAKSLAKV